MKLLDIAAVSTRKERQNQITNNEDMAESLVHLCN